MRLIEERNLTPEEALRRLFGERPEEEQRAWLDRSSDAMRATNAWADAHEVSVEAVRDWVGYWQKGLGKWEEFAVVGPWWSGAPLEDIARELDRRAGDGWTIAHVSEDSGVYSGTDVQEESFPTRIRFLLRRSA